MTGARYTTVENLSAGIAIIWGAMVANPMVETFAKYPKLYEPMLGFLPYEAFWGSLFIAAGATGLFLNWKERNLSASFLMAFVFIMFATLFFFGDSYSQAWGVYGLIGLFNLIHWRAHKWNLKQRKP